jgi:hypothetical protein
MNLRTLQLLACSLLAGAALAAASAAGADSVSAAAYARGVTQACKGALLFDHRHPMGTRADAVAVARDIRASTARRLAVVAAVPVPAALRSLDERWIAMERRLAATYARLWVQIYDTIDQANTAAQKAALPAQLELLVHAPDMLKHAAGRLELVLRIPDCTGGG